LIGTPATTVVIEHQDGKVKEYIEDYYSNIFFLDLLEQLRDYQREDRRKYDLVIAMGLCELADEDMFGVAARGEDSPTSDFSVFGYFTDEHGIKHFGKIPKQENPEAENLTKPGALSMATWIDMSGKLRFDDNFEIGDADDLPTSSQGSNTSPLE
jgi:predicted nucleotidyltransferase